MCLAIPGKIISIDESSEDIKMAKVSFAGVVKEICTEWINEPKIGEYVLVHAGFALNKVDEHEAEETLQMLRSIEDDMNGKYSA